MNESILPTYTGDNTMCPKCHHRVIRTHWHEPNRYLGNPQGHLARTCALCGFSWKEAPLDATPPAAAPTQPPAPLDTGAAWDANDGNYWLIFCRCDTWSHAPGSAKSVWCPKCHHKWSRPTPGYVWGSSFSRAGTASAFVKNPWAPVANTTCLDDVRAFMERAGHQMAKYPNPGGPLSPAVVDVLHTCVGDVHRAARTLSIRSDLQAFRMRLILEEVAELMVALAVNDLVEVADALVDLRYVTDAAVLAFGLGDYFPQLWAEVHRANMAKFQEPVRYDDQGKVIKPEGWTPPDLHSILQPDNPK